MKGFLFGLLSGSSICMFVMTMVFNENTHVCHEKEYQDAFVNCQQAIIDYNRQDTGAVSWRWKLDTVINEYHPKVHRK